MDKKMFFKYKSISTDEQMEYAKDIIINNKIYFPKYDQLNDPLEGALPNIILDGYAGMSIAIESGEELEPVRSAKDGYRILSLSSDPMSAQMWAHYGDNYAGICLGFSDNGAFCKAKIVNYSNDRKNYECYDNDEIDEAVKDSFFYKSKGWEYEKEWRLVEKTTDEFITMSKNDLKVIVFGQKTPDKKIKELKRVIPSNIQLFKTRVLKGKYKIVLEPLDYKYDYDGSKRFEIHQVRKLISCLGSANYPGISYGQNKYS